MISPYSEVMEAFISEIDQSFYEAFDLTGPYQDTDHLPGERYGMLDFQTYTTDPNRPQLQSVRGGVEAKIFRASLLISSAFDQGDLSETECLRTANNIFLSEALNIDSGLSVLKLGTNNQQFLWDIRLDTPIDKAVSVSLHDEPGHRTWIVSATCGIAINFMVARDLNGNHVLPLTANDIGH